MVEEKGRRDGGRLKMAIYYSNNCEFKGKPAERVSARKYPYAVETKNSLLFFETEAEAQKVVLKQGGKLHRCVVKKATSGWVEI